VGRCAHVLAVAALVAVEIGLLGPSAASADPFGEQAELLGHGGGFGGSGDHSVALSADGNTALVGALDGKSGEPPSALIFTRSGSTWSQPVSLVPEGDEPPEEGFGASVALSADGSTALGGSMPRAVSRDGWDRARRELRTAVAALVALTATTCAFPALAAATRAPSPALECAAQPSTTSEASPGPAVLSMLAVLRSPQTALDTLPASSLPGGVPHMGEGIYIKYVREAGVILGTSYYVIPVAKGCASSKEEVILYTDTARGFSGWSGATLHAIERGRLLGSEGTAASSVVSGIVPDGVATVTLEYAAAKPSAMSPTKQRAVTVTAKPVNNVFAVRVPQNPGSASLPKAIVWRSAKGAVIKRIHPAS
jgi:hypothetical protein